MRKTEFMVIGFILLLAVGLLSLLPGGSSSSETPPQDPDMQKAMQLTGMTEQEVRQFASEHHISKTEAHHMLKHF
ncbi:MAG: hypothetical protein JO316_06365 [Abitibacteriaceae bacterium]|nr:hypothetical protein [Abditibacteriaceae bacterium]